MKVVGRSLPYRHIYLTTVFGVAFWSVVIALSYVWNMSNERGKTRKLALSTAHA